MKVRFEALYKIERIMQPDTVNALKISFWKLCENQVPQDELIVEKAWCALYCTQQSIINNFSQVFGYRNDGLANRFYNLLAERQRLRRIYLPTFIIKLKGLCEGSVMEVNMFAFNLFDGDQDGILLGNDIADLLNDRLRFCPPMNPDYPMVKLDGCASIANYSKLDKRCKCAFS